MLNEWGTMYDAINVGEIWCDRETNDDLIVESLYLNTEFDTMFAQMRNLNEGWTTHVSVNVVMDTMEFKYPHSG